MGGKMMSVSVKVDDVFACSEEERLPRLQWQFSSLFSTYSVSVSVSLLSICFCDDSLSETQHLAVPKTSNSNSLRFV